MCGDKFSEGHDNLKEGRKALRNDKLYTIYFKANPYITLLAKIVC